MNLYFDTSALCRYYHSEAGSDKVRLLAGDATSRCVVSWLTVLEAHSAFAHKVRLGEIDAIDLLTLKKKLAADIKRHQWNVVRVLRSHYESAAGLIMHYGVSKRLRSLDALHLAILLDLQNRSEADCMVTAGLILAEVAIADGITVLPPLSA